MAEEGQIHGLNKRENAKGMTKIGSGVTFGCKILDNFQLAASGRKRIEKITTL